MQTGANSIGPRLVELVVCGHEITDATQNFVVAKPRSKVPKDWRPARLLTDGPKHQKVYLPPEEWTRIVEMPRKVEVTFNVGGVLVTGEARQVLPWRYRRSHRCPADWPLAYTEPTGAKVRLSPDDYVRIVTEQRGGSADEDWQEALDAHVVFLTRLEMLKLIERRIRGLRDCYLPKPVVDGGLFNHIPQAYDWPHFIVNAEGDVSCESLARAGLLTKIGIPDPCCFRVSKSPWTASDISVVFPSKVLDDNDLAWAEELRRETHKATEPYRQLSLANQCGISFDAVVAAAKTGTGTHAGGHYWRSPSVHRS